MSISIIIGFITYIVYIMLNNKKEQEEKIKKELLNTVLELKLNKLENNYNVIEIKNEKEDINEICECSICYDEKELKNFVKLGCNHEFCKDCLITTMKTSEINGNNLSCALCRTEVKSVKSRTEQVYTEMSELIA